MDSCKRKKLHTTVRAFCTFNLFSCRAISGFPSRTLLVFTVFHMNNSDPSRKYEIWNVAKLNGFNERLKSLSKYCLSKNISIFEQ